MQSIATSVSNNSSSKKRGRPPGSKNKAKSETSPDSDPICPTILPPISNSKHQSGDSQKRRPGRPPKVKTSNGTTLLLSHDSFHSSPSQDPIHIDTDADAVLHLHSPIGGRSPVHSHESAEDETAAAVSTLFKSDTDGHGDSGISLQLTLTPLLPTGPVSSPAIVNQLRLFNEAPNFSSNPRTSFAPTPSGNSLQPAPSTTCSAPEIGIKSNGPLHSEVYRLLPTGSSLVATHTSSFNATPLSNHPCDPACSTVPKHLCNSVCNPQPPRLQSQLPPSELVLPSPSSPCSKSSLKPSSRKERKANRARDKGAITTQATASNPEFDALLKEIVERLQKVRIASSSGKQPNGGAPRANASPLSPPVVPSSESAKFTWTRSFSSPAGAICTGSSSESCRLHAFNNFVVDLTELRSHLKRLNEQQPDSSSSDLSLRKPQLELESLLLRTLRCTSDKFTALFGKAKTKTKAKTKAKAKPKRKGEHSVSPTRTSPSRSSLHSEQPELEDCAAVNASNSKRQSKSKNGAHRSTSVKSLPKHSSSAAARLNSRSDSESSKKCDRRSSSSSSGKRNRALKEESSNRSASNSPLRRQSSSPSPAKDRKAPKTSSPGANTKRKRKAKSKASAIQKPAALPPPPSPPSSRSPSPPDRAKSAHASRRQRDNKGRFAPEPSEAPKPAPASRSNSREPLHIDVRRSTATSASSLSAHDNKSPNRTKHKHHHRHHKSTSKPEQPSPDAEPSETARLGVVSPETVSFDDFVLSLKANNVVSKLDPRSLRKACKAHSKSARGNDKSTTAIAASVAIPIDRARSSSGETLTRKELRAILSAATAAQIQSTAGATRTKEVASLVSSLAAPASPPPSHPSLDKKQQQRRHKRKSGGSTADRSTSTPPLSGERSAPSAASGVGGASSSRTGDETSGAVGALPPKKRFKSRPPRSSPPPPAAERVDSPAISPDCPAEDVSPLPAAVASTLTPAKKSRGRSGHRDKKRTPLVPGDTARPPSPSPSPSPARTASPASVPPSSGAVSPGAPGASAASHASPKGKATGKKGNKQQEERKREERGASASKASAWSGGGARKRKLAPSPSGATATTRKRTPAKDGRRDAPSPPRTFVGVIHPKISFHETRQAQAADTKQMNLQLRQSLFASEFSMTFPSTYAYKSSRSRAAFSVAASRLYLPREDPLSINLRGAGRAIRTKAAEELPVVFADGRTSLSDAESTRLLRSLGVALPRNLLLTKRARPHLSLSSASQYSPTSSARSPQAVVRAQLLQVHRRECASLVFSAADSAAAVEHSLRRRNFLQRFAVGSSYSMTHTPASASSIFSPGSPTIAIDTPTVASARLYGITGSSACVTPRHADTLNKLLRQLLDDLLFKLKELDSSSEGISANSPLLKLPSKHLFPEFYWSISEPVSFETVMYKLNRKAYSCFEEFDYDILRAFLVTQTYCGYSTPLGQLVEKLREAYRKLKLAALDQYEMELLELHESLHAEVEADGAADVQAAGASQPLRALNDLYRRRLESSALLMQANPGAPVEEGFEEVEVIRCVCGAVHDEGVMLQCDQCYVWQHLDCMRVWHRFAAQLRHSSDAERKEIDDEEHYLCEICSQLADAEAEAQQSPGDDECLPNRFCPRVMPVDIPLVQSPPDAVRDCSYYLTLAVPQGTDELIHELKQRRLARCCDAAAAATCADALADTSSAMSLGLSQLASYSSESAFGGGCARPSPSSTSESKRARRRARLASRFRLDNCCLLMDPTADSYCAFRQISLGDYVYVDVPTPPTAANLALSPNDELDTPNAPDESTQARLSSGRIVPPFRAQCYIVRVERIWRDATGTPYIFGNYLLRPHELLQQDSSRNKYFFNEVVQSPFLDVFAVSGGSGGPGHVRGVCSVLAPEQVVLGHQRAISNYLCGASDTLVCALRLGKLSQSELTKAALKTPVCTRPYFFHKLPIRLRFERQTLDLAGASRTRRPIDVIVGCTKRTESSSSSDQSEADSCVYRTRVQRSTSADARRSRKNAKPFHVQSA